MAVHKALCSSSKKFFSSQMRCLVKQQFCHRLWLFSPSAAQSCFIQIHDRTCSSIPHDVPYQQETVSEQSDSIQIQDDESNSDSRPSQMHHLLNDNKTTTGSNSLKIDEEGIGCLSINKGFYPEYVMKITETTSRDHRFMRNENDLKGTSCQSEPSCSSDPEFNKVKPRRLLNIYTDASGRYGLGCVWDKKWIVSQWEDEWLSNNYRCMEHLEMKAVLVAILTWGHDWTGSIVRIHCDNKMVVEYFNHRARLNSKVSKAYKSIKFAAAELGFELIMEQANKSHVRFQGTDSLSRLDFSRFQKLLPYVNSFPDLPPRDLEFLLPNLWENICVSVKLRSQNDLSGFRRMTER